MFENADRVEINNEVYKIINYNKKTGFVLIQKDNKQYKLYVNSKRTQQVKEDFILKDKKNGFEEKISLKDIKIK